MFGYGYEMRSLTLREERLRLSEIKVLRRLLGHIMKEETG